MALFLLSFTVAVGAVQAPISINLDAPLPDTLVKIAICESGDVDHPVGNALAKNSTSTASGRFQFIHSTWIHYAKMLWGKDYINKDVFNWEDNTELAEYVYANFGTADWDSSRHCWK